MNLKTVKNHITAIITQSTVAKMLLKTENEDMSVLSSSYSSIRAVTIGGSTFKL